MSALVKAFEALVLKRLRVVSSQKSFLNNKISLNEAESVADLIDAVDEKRLGWLADRCLANFLKI